MQATTIWEFVSRNWAAFAITGTLLALLVFVVANLGRYVRLILNLFQDTPPPLAIGPMDFKRVEGQHVTFRSCDGTALRGMYLDARNGRSKGMIIFCHEFGSDMYSCARYCRHLLEAGYDLFTFDFRGHGGSSDEEGYTPRQWVTDREVADVMGAIAFVEDWLEQHNLPVEVGLFGISRGACAAILAAEQYPRVRCIVADGAFSTDSIIEYLMRRWADIFAKVRFVYENHPPQFWRFLRWIMLACASRKFNCKFPSVRKALKRMSPRPILFIHGERDSYVPVEQTKILYDLAPEPKELWIAPNAKHNQSVALWPEQYAARTLAFFDRHLAGVLERVPQQEPARRKAEPA